MGSGIEFLLMRRAFDLLLDFLPLIQQGLYSWIARNKWTIDLKRGPAGK